MLELCFFMGVVVVVVVAAAAGSTGEDSGPASTLAIMGDSEPVEWRLAACRRLRIWTMRMAITMRKAVKARKASTAMTAMAQWGNGLELMLDWSPDAVGLELVDRERAEDEDASAAAADAEDADMDDKTESA
jgi:hypothetical protein